MEGAGRGSGDSIGSDRSDRKAGAVTRGTVKRRGIVDVSQCERMFGCEEATCRAAPERKFRAEIAYCCALEVAAVTYRIVDCYLNVVRRYAIRAMKIIEMFKWLRKDILHRNGNSWNTSPNQSNLNNSESYRNALQAFIDRRRFSEDVSFDSAASCSSPEKRSVDLVLKRNNKKEDNDFKYRECRTIVPGVHHIPASDIFEIGWVPGTEDRYCEFINAEWQNTRVSLKRHTHPECIDAVKADLEVLAEMRHPNLLLLMATTQTEDHGLVSIFEPVNSTLYSYVHDQGERISVQGIAKCGGRLADALKHAHMRGYVHGAISSHCVFLVHGGIVKLGGWELARRVQNSKLPQPQPKKHFEERLRAEIFRWLPPEYFSDCELSPASDVYGLCLLLWEISTRHVPWGGYNQADVKKQYTVWKRGVIMNLYDFPPLLYNLLEVGLQLDVMKRTLDMTRMRRYLQRLEMQFEDSEPVYIQQNTDGNNDNTFVSTSKSPTKVSKNKSAKITDSEILKQLFCSKDSTAKKEFLNAEKSVEERTQINLFDSSQDGKENSAENLQKTTKLFSKQKNNDNTKLQNTNTSNEKCKNEKVVKYPWHSTYKKIKFPKEALEDENDAVLLQPSSSISISDEDIQDVRISIKRLKEAIANKREEFFYGTGAQMPGTSSEEKNTSTQIKSKDCQRYKPANHKTSFEPKIREPLGEHHLFGNTYKVTRPRYPRKAKALNSQASEGDENFFESSLWKKEKMICLLKMGKDDEPNTSSKGHSAIAINDNTKIECSIPENEKNKDTYILDETTANGTKENEGNTTNSESVLDTPTEPLQELKDALDRATRIIHSGSSSTSEKRLCSSLKNLAISMEDLQARESLFEAIYGLNDNVDEEIRSIERTTEGNKFSTTTSGSTSKEPEILNMCSEEEKLEVDSVSKNSFMDATHTRFFLCESIPEVSNESSACNSNQSTNRTNTPVKDGNTGNPTNIQAEPTKRDEKESKKTNDARDAHKRESLEKRFNLLLLNDSFRERNCRTCHRKDTSPRRRSLPAGLGYLRSPNSSLGRLSIRRGDLLDNTLEDLYIDDEFGGSLNINMVLMLEDTTLEDLFPRSLEMPIE